MLDIKLLPQEESVNAKFDGTLFMTAGFQDVFGLAAPLLALYTVNKIINERVASSEGADYLQIAECTGTRYWIIDDQNGVITVLMPEDY